MSLSNKQIYCGLVYRKAVYNFSCSDAFKKSFIGLKKLSRSVIIDRLHLSKYTKSFDNNKDEFEYFDQLEESLQFDENEWSNNVSKLKEFFIIIINEDPEGPFKVLKRDYRNLFKSLSDIIDDSIEISTINLDTENFMNQSPDMYSSDNPNNNSNLGSTMQTIDGATNFISKPLDPNKCYHINRSGRRGICLLVNIWRKYSFLDVPPARQIFEGFNYEVRVLHHVTAQDYILSLKKIREEIAQLKSDSFIMIFSSHGDENDVVFEDNKTIDRATIINQFGSEYCPCLQNKPKLFFFQNCRTSLGHDEVTSKYEFLMDDTCTSEQDKSKSNSSIPSDISCFYATADGTIAYRDDSGSIYLQALYEILRNPEKMYWPITHIEIYLRSLVLERTGSQLPECVTTLTKDFYFCKPKY